MIILRTWNTPTWVLSFPESTMVLWLKWVALAVSNHTFTSLNGLSDVREQEERPHHKHIELVQPIR